MRYVALAAEFVENAAAREDYLMPTATPEDARRVALVVHPTGPEAKTLAVRVREWWEARGYEVLEVGGDEPPEGEGSDGFVFSVSLGGDGTVLRAVRFAVVRGHPGCRGEPRQPRRT